MHSYWFFLEILLFPLIFRITFLLRGQKVPLGEYLAGLGQELFFGQILLFLGFLIQKGVFLLAIPFQFYLVLDSFLCWKIKTRLEPAIFWSFKELPSFWSSLKALSFFKFAGIAAVLMIFNSLLFVACDTSLSFSYWMLIPLGTSALGFTKKLSYTMIHPFLLFGRKKEDTIPTSHDFLRKVPLKDKPHVIFVFMESFRAKDISEEHSPHFWALREEGIYFSHFYANAVKTSRAALASLQGVAPFLSAQGYATAYLHNGSLSFEGQRELFTYLGFQHLMGRNELLNAFPDALGNSWGIYDEYLMEYAAQFLEKNAHQPCHQPTLMTLATITNHHPWTPPPGKESKKTNREKFLQTFTYSDAALGMFIQRLKEKGLYEKSLIFILGDHGQPMGEHSDNPLAQSGLYEENVHIPLLILGKGRIFSRISNSLGSQVDLLATLKDLLGYPSPQSLLREGGKKIAFFHSPSGRGYLGCREKNDKYILITSTHNEMLFDLEKDPNEQRNIAKEHPEKVKKYREAVKAYSFPSLPSQLPKEEKFLIHLRGCLKTTDEKLEEIIRKKRGVQIVDLKDCLQLSDRGIGKLWKLCPHLEHVNLSGIDEITDQAFENFQRQNKKMVHFEMLNCPKVTIQGLTFLIKAFPNLQKLALSCAHLGEFPDLTCCQLHFLHLQQGYHLSGPSLLSFLNAQPQLRHVIFEDCPTLTDGVLRGLRQGLLKKITFLSCPEITDQGLLILQDPALIFLEIYNCPQVTPTCLQQLTERGLHILV